MRLNYPAPHAQLPPWLTAKTEADRINTHASTQHTAREQPQLPPQHYDLYNRKDHISLVESTVEERAVPARKAKPPSNSQQLLYKSSSSIPYQ